MGLAIALSSYHPLGLGTLRVRLASLEQNKNSKRLKLRSLRKKYCSARMGVSEGMSWGWSCKCWKTSTCTQLLEKRSIPWATRTGTGSGIKQMEAHRKEPAPSPIQPAHSIPLRPTLGGTAQGAVGETGRWLPSPSASITKRTREGAVWSGETIP